MNKKISSPFALTTFHMLNSYARSGYSKMSKTETRRKITVISIVSENNIGEYQLPYFTFLSTLRKSKP